MKRFWKRMAVVCVLLSACHFSCKEIFLTQKEYWPNGQLKRKHPKPWMRFPSGPVKPGWDTSWYENGALKFRGRVDRLGKMDGMQTWYSQDGTILDQWIYHGGIPASGTRIAKWSDGTTKQEVTYDAEGEWNGRVLKKSRSGKVLLDWAYSHGKPADGRTLVYGEDGEPCLEFESRDGWLVWVAFYGPKGCLSYRAQVNFRIKRIVLINGDSICGRGNSPRTEYGEESFATEYDALQIDMRSRNCV